MSTRDPLAGEPWWIRLLACVVMWGLMVVIEVCELAKRTFTGHR